MKNFLAKAKKVFYTLFTREQISLVWYGAKKFSTKKINTKEKN